MQILVIRASDGEMDVLVADTPETARAELRRWVHTRWEAQVLGEELGDDEDISYYLSKTQTKVVDFER